MNRTGEYRHNPFMLDDQNLPKDLKLYDISRDVSTTELGRSDTHPVPPPMKAQLLLHPSAAHSSISLQPAFELDVGGRTKSLAGSGMIEREWGKSLRPVRQQRVSSWLDVRSAWNDEGFWMSGKGKTRARVNTTLDETREENGVDDLDEGKETANKWREKGVESDHNSSGSVKMLRARRSVVLPLSVWIDIHVRGRRSYHDLDSLRTIKVLSPEWMKLDVELCAQVLIMVRREEHLQNVVACLEVSRAMNAISIHPDK